MSDALTRYPIEKLVQWIFAEEETGSIFGIPQDLFFVPQKAYSFQMERYGQVLETPIGVAAGPHTQLSQNLIASWLSGARYLELKTVQVLDELEVTKPCIKMEDEGYNCEWSQELKLEQSYQEYLNAWIIIHLLKDKFHWGKPDQRGFIFNMSVGYNLEGILSSGVQSFLEKLADCSKEKAEKIERLARFYPPIKDIDIPDCISDNITISTMHGCPPEEIEKIGLYCINEKKLHTTIKLNPTLLGPEQLRSILNKTLGFDIVVPDEAFEHDLKYPAAVDLINNLQKSAKTQGVGFGLKLTNTLETLNKPGNLPETETMVYMSGRPLHVISINVAAKLQEEFKGELDLSFSAGVDCFNVPQVLSCGLKPVTVCSDILKPGGYTRLGQYLEEIEKRIRLKGASSIEEFIQHSAGIKSDLHQAALKNLHNYAREVIHDRRYAKSHFPFAAIKTGRDLPLFDCTQAPCLTACPTEQDIPAYLGFTADGHYEEAHRVILHTNPFPNMQGKVCHHPCRTKCTRINLDSPLKIREIKRFIAEQYSDSTAVQKKPANGKTVGIIGGGPSGLSCAYFLALEGFQVDIFEAKSMLGGMAADAIPAFRLDEISLQSDINRITSLGVNTILNSPVDAERFAAMRRDYDYLYIAVGAQESMKLGIDGEDGEGVIDPLDFLSQVKWRQPPALGKHVIVIGAGNSAMDAARTAKRLVGKDGMVTILYRRTRQQMSADFEEISETLAEGISLVELVAPEKIIRKEGKVCGIECSQMKLGSPDKSGRASPVKIENSILKFEADSIIPAIGQKIKLNFLPGKSLHVDPVTYQTDIKDVFCGGDAMRGAATLIEAIADGRRTAENIIKYALNHEREKQLAKPRRFDLNTYFRKLAIRNPGLVSHEPVAEVPSGFGLISATLDKETARNESERCLSCDLYCAICTTVCPNRANIAFPVDPTTVPVQVVEQSENGVLINDSDPVLIEQPLQILNVGDFCNECGNCTTFCPTNGAPYRVKPRFCLSRESFNKEKNGYLLQGDTLVAKINGQESSLMRVADSLMFESPHLKATLNIETLKASEVTVTNSRANRLELKQAAIMGFLWRSLKEFHLFRLT